MLHNTGHIDATYIYLLMYLYVDPFVSSYLRLPCLVSRGKPTLKTSVIKRKNIVMFIFRENVISAATAIPSLVC